MRHWRKKNPIPPDQARWGRFNELAEYNRQYLHNILERESANDPKRTPVMQKIGDMYQSCMDETAVNAKGSTPLKPRLDRHRCNLQQRPVAGDDCVFAFVLASRFCLGSVPLLTCTTPACISPTLARAAWDCRIGIITSDTDTKSQETREKYLDHMGNMFVLLGDDEAAAKKKPRR